MKKFNKSYLLGILGLALAAWIAWKTGDISMKLVSNEPGPKFFPYLAAAGIALMSVLSLIFDGKKEAKEIAEGKAKPYLDKAGWVRMGLFLLLTVIFAFSMHYLGFWITSMVGGFAYLWLLKGNKKVNPIWAAVFCIIIGSICYFSFTRIFFIPLPKGELWKLLGIKML